MFKKLSIAVNKMFNGTQTAPSRKGPLPPLILEPNPGNAAMDDFRPEEAEPCFCGSEKLFKSCCGSRESKRPPPYGVFVFEDYIDTTLLKKLTEFAEKQPGERLKVIDQEASTADNIVVVEDDRRISEYVNMGPHQPMLNEFIKSTFTELAEKWFERQIEWFERPHVLRYHPGGFYIKHADNANMDPQTWTWSRAMDRDLSLLLYLNDDFSGGALRFEKFNFKIHPKAGMAVLFPSDHRYMHAAEIVTKGVRYAVVSWAAVKGIPKISTKPPKVAIPVN